MFTREEWVELAREWAAVRIVETTGEDLPLHRVGIGFPGTGRRGKRIGECWPATATADGAKEVFVSPILDGATVISTLIHELIHVALEQGVKHGPPFRKLALAVGLSGKMRSTVAGVDLTNDIAQWMKKTGDSAVMGQPGR